VTADATAADVPLQAHSYLTDGVNLYRVTGWMNRSAHAIFAELEDCRTLELVLVRAEHLARSALRPVIAATAAG
jgi:hypothetical protein